MILAGTSLIILIGCSASGNLGIRQWLFIDQCPWAGEHRAHVAVPERPTLAWPCPAHGGWTLSKGCPLWWNCIRLQTGWLSNAVLHVQECVEEGQEVRQDHSQLMRSRCSWLQQPVSCCPDRCQESWGQEGAAVAWHKWTTQSKRDFHALATNSVHMQQLWKRLPAQELNFTPSKSMLSQYRELTFLVQSIVFQVDRRQQQPAPDGRTKPKKYCWTLL